VVPAGFAAEDVPRSISFVGRLHDEATVLGLARLYDGVTTWHLQHPVGY
jgi:Asp-tRNA(Asn)/Glu-tRNA(Gln) amidotransferase A subunit family amidase